MGRAAPPARRDRQVVRILGILKLLGEGARPSVHQLAARFKTFETFRWHTRGA